MNKVGVFGTSNKKYEKRIPLHPELFDLIPEKIKKQLFFEEKYANELGITESFLNEHFGGVLSRDKLFDKTDVWLLPKPEKNDYQYFSEGKILWGWPHCVQGIDITQAAIDEKMTIVAWEAMYGGKDNTHVFYRNNELAGFAAVQHMMMLTGRNGYFGRKLKAAVMGFGATARGAISSLKSLGINNITVFSQRPSYLINAPVESVNYKQMKVIDGECFLENNYFEDVNAATELADYDLVVNCILQNPLQPINFISENEISYINKQLDIIDISCDEGMGFYFAKPTTFDTPMLKINNYINYYSVDHTPTLYWDSASYEITKSIIEFLPMFVDGQWQKNKVLDEAVEIIDGKIVNNKILDFQKRHSIPPYNYINEK